MYFLKKIEDWSLKISHNQFIFEIGSHHDYSNPEKLKNKFKLKKWK